MFVHSHCSRFEPNNTTNRFQCRLLILILNCIISVCYLCMVVIILFCQAASHHAGIVGFAAVILKLEDIVQKLLVENVSASISNIPYVGIIFQVLPF